MPKPTHLLTGLLLLLMASACYQEPTPAPLFTTDPEGVDRNAHPQIIIKNKAVFYEGHLVETRKTTVSELTKLIKHKLTDEEGMKFWDKTGVYFFLNTDSIYTEIPINTVEHVSIDLRQEEDWETKRPCTPEELKAQKESIDERIKGMIRQEQKLGFDYREDKKRVLRERCTAPGLKPKNPFRGYLEVDGIPIGSKMTFAEVQARRKQLGLLPLAAAPLDPGGRYYRAVTKKHDPTSWGQEWIFEWQNGKGHDECLLQSIFVH